MCQLNNGNLHSANPLNITNAEVPQYNYVTFLNASNVFDRLKYWIIFNKLIKKHVPLVIIKLLFFGIHT